MKYRAYGYDADGKIVMKSVIYEDISRARFWAARFEKSVDCVVKGVVKEVKR